MPSPRKMCVAESIVRCFIAFSDPGLRSCLKSRAAVFMNETFFSLYIIETRRVSVLTEPLE